MKRFFDDPNTKWRKNEGLLHLYAVFRNVDVIRQESTNIADALSKYSQKLSLQPVDYLHMTIQRLSAYRDDLDDAQWSTFIEELQRSVKQCATFDIRFQPATVRQSAIEAVGTQYDEWECLNSVVLQACITAGLREYIVEPPFGPHYTHSYCIQETSEDEDAEISSILHNISQTTHSVIDCIELVSVNQDPDKGVFTFQTLATFPLQ